MDKLAKAKKYECIQCRLPAKSFRDLISLKEFAISKLCQECQDKAFKEEKEE